MAGAERPLLHHFLHRRRQGQQAQHVDDVAATSAEVPGQILRGMPELLDQPTVAIRLFDCIEVLPLNVLDERELQRLPIVKRANDDRHLMQLGALCGTPASFAGDDLITLACRFRPHQDRLHNAVLANGRREPLQFLFLKTMAWLQRPRRQ